MSLGHRTVIGNDRSKHTNAIGAVKDKIYEELSRPYSDWKRLYATDIGANKVPADLTGEREPLSSVSGLQEDSLS